MEKLYIKPTTSTPEIILDPSKHQLIIRGESRPEDALEFFSPVKEWLDHYKIYIHKLLNTSSNPITIQCTFDLEYFNSTSAKWFKDIMLHLVNLKQKFQKITVDIMFTYEEGDEDTLEIINEYSKMINYPIKPIVK